MTQTNPPTKTKDPDEAKDWQFDFSKLLESGETISSHVIDVASGITLGAHTNTSTAVTVWLSGGALAGNYRLACRVVTSLGRTYEDAFTINVRAK